MSSTYRKARRRIAKNGRSEGSGRFAMLPETVYGHAVFRRLRPGPRALLIELLIRYNGRNNGAIGLGIREACLALNVRDHATVCGYFNTLQDAGFIAVAKDAAFNLKVPDSRRSREWRLTWEPAPGLKATFDFKRLEAEREREERVGKAKRGRAEKPNVIGFIGPSRSGKPNLSAHPVPAFALG